MVLGIPESWHSDPRGVSLWIISPPANAGTPARPGGTGKASAEPGMVLGNVKSQ